MDYQEVSPWSAQRSFSVTLIWLWGRVVTAAGLMRCREGVGRRWLESAAKSNLKRVCLELGAKSPNIVLADAPDLDEAAKMSAN